MGKALDRRWYADDVSVCTLEGEVNQLGERFGFDPADVERSLCRVDDDLQVFQIRVG